MAEKPEPKGWPEECVDGVELEVPDAVRATLKDRLKGAMQERSLRSGELTKLATALLEQPKGVDSEEKAS